MPTLVLPVPSRMLSASICALDLKSEQVKATSPDAVVIVVSNPLDAMVQRAFQVTGFSPARVIGHCDAAPWNIVASDGLAVALIDWDRAGPVEPLVELAQVCWLKCEAARWHPRRTRGPAVRRGPRSTPASDR